MQLITTVFFWVFVWPEEKKDPQFSGDIKHSRIFMVNIVPLTFLLFDWLWLNAMPIVLRHCLLIIPVNIIYVLINLMTSLLDDHPVYPEHMDWEKPVGIIVGVSIPILYGVIFAIIRWINQYKLRYLGHTEIADCIDGKQLDYI